MTADRPLPDLDTRVATLAEGADLAPVAEALETRHDEIVDRWLRRARRQPFHRDQAALAVSDHIPELLRAIAGVIRRGGPREVDVEAPLDDEAVANAAAAHAQARFEQGLGPVAIATEFRLLRQEISAVLIERLDDHMLASDVVSSIMVVSDALDGATILALAGLTERIETLREEFLATTLHDVRQPITVVEGSLVLAARWLARPTFDTEQLVETLHGALLASQELSLFVDALSDASQLAMASLQLEREPVPASEVVSDAIAALPGDHRSRVRLVDGSARAIGDWDHRAVRRVLRNLLSNAIKYSPPDTPIDLVVERDGSDVHITIADHGIGFTDADLAVLFQRFGRSDAVRAAGLPGVGLGLYACRGLVEAHDGQIWLESPGPDQGTIAHIRLPMLLEEPADL
ncbi:MAG TPA: HAMP domain-containing sensor histidine kinase [Candidatus Limnocylindrales bacterium]|nr:HAMP domain-containing sensor histidine kinase [Candidatus Limnocylindrales bacterium]